MVPPLSVMVCLLNEATGLGAMPLWQRRPTASHVAGFSYLPNFSQLVPHFLPVEVQNKEDNNTPPAGLFPKYSHTLESMWT